MTPVLEKPYISVSINPENIRFCHFTNGGHTRKSIMAAPMFLRIKRSILKQQWTIEEISIFSNSSLLECRVGLSDTILKGTHQGAIPARFGLIWFSGFRGEDLNVTFYQNMPNLHNRYKSTERKISQKNPEYMLNYSLPCSYS